MAAPTYVAAGTAVSGTGAINVAWPAGNHQAGDIGILVVSSSNETVATPSGWTLVGNTGTGTAATVDSSGCYVFWKRAASGSEAVAAVADSGNRTIGVIAVYRGCSTSDPPLEAVATSVQSSNATSYTLPGTTTLGPDRRVVCALASGQEATYSSWSHGGLTGFAANGSGTTTSGLDGSVACSSGVKASAGATGTGFVTASITSKAAFVTFALKPPAVELPVKWVPRIAGNNVAYSWTIPARGAPTTWSITSGALPPGMSLSNAGVISGTCTVNGTYSFTVQASDGTTSDSFSASIRVRAPIAADQIQVVRYAGTGSATTVGTVGLDMSAGGAILVFDDLDTTGTAPTSWLMISPDGTTVAHARYADFNNPGYSTTGASFANGSFTVPASMSVSGRTYHALVFKKGNGLVDAFTYAGTGAAVTRTISLTGTAALCHVMSSQATDYLYGRHPTIGDNRRWGPKGWVNTTNQITACGNNSYQADASVSVTGQTYYGFAVAQLAKAVTASHYNGNGSIGGPMLNTDGCKARAILLAGNENVGASGQRVWVRDLQPSGTFVNGSGTPRARYTWGVNTDPFSAQSVVDVGGTPPTGLQIQSTDQFINNPGELFGYIVFMEDEPPSINGTLAGTLDAATVSATGTVSGGLSPIAGALSATLGAASVAATGTVSAIAALTATLAPATFTASGAAPVVGSLSRTLGAATASATGTAPVVGQAGVTLAATTLAAAGNLNSGAQAGLTATLGDASVASTGTAPIAGSSARTLASATIAATGTARCAGQLAGSLAAATLASTATAPIRGALTATLGNATGASTATAPTAGAATRTLDAATLLATGNARVQGSLSATLASSTSSATGAAPTVGSLSQSLASASLAASGSVGLTGAASLTADAATVTATAAVRVAGQGASLLQDAALTGTGAVAAHGTLTATLADTVLAAVGAAQLESNGVLAGVLDAATVSAAAAAHAHGTLALVTDNATAASEGVAPIIGALQGALDGATCLADGIVFTYSNGALNAALAAASVIAAGTIIVAPRRRPIPMGFERPTPDTVEALQVESDVQTIEQERTESFGALRPRTPAVQ